MWSLGRSYGIRMDIFAGHRLVTAGPYALVRHPMYLGIVLFHIGASLALESTLLLAATLLYVVPLTAIRVVAEDKVLAAAFGESFAAHRRSVPTMLPFRSCPRPPPRRSRRAGRSSSPASSLARRTASSRVRPGSAW